MARRMMFAAAGERPAEPISTINTTPLIDLMLVLLIMFILAVPVATHKVPLDLPTAAPPPTEPVPPPLVHRLSLDAAGRLDWNGRAVTDRQLLPLLAQLAREPSDPELHIDVDPETRYERVDIILAEIRRAGVTRLGFVGNERFARAIDG
jgi:biopolymer transport protein ExbD